MHRIDGVLKLQTKQNIKLLLISFLKIQCTNEHAITWKQ